MSVVYKCQHICISCFYNLCTLSKTKLNFWKGFAIEAKDQEDQPYAYKFCTKKFKMHSVLKWRKVLNVQYFAANKLWFYTPQPQLLCLWLEKLLLLKEPSHNIVCLAIMCSRSPLTAVFPIKNIWISINLLIKIPIECTRSKILTKSWQFIDKILTWSKQHVTICKLHLVLDFWPCFVNQTNSNSSETWAIIMTYLSPQ